MFGIAAQNRPQQSTATLNPRRSPLFAGNCFSISAADATRNRCDRANSSLNPIGLPGRATHVMLCTSNFFGSDPRRAFRQRAGSFAANSIVCLPFFGLWFVAGWNGCGRMDDHIRTLRRPRQRIDMKQIATAALAAQCMDDRSFCDFAPAPQNLRAPLAKLFDQSPSKHSLSLPR